VPDSLFCHRCGKPQRDIIVPETVEPPVENVVPEVVAARAAAPPPSFKNPVATKIALTVAGIGTLLSFLPYINFLAAGFFAVFFYRRRTGVTMNMESGVRIGWMTGVIMFAIMGLLLTLGVVIMRAAGGGIPQEFRGSFDPRVIEAINKLVQSGTMLLSALVEMFVLTTLLAMAGGALGAKLVGRATGPGAV
jgi:predicted DNA repair protein MutK